MNHETDWFARVTPIQHHQIKIGALIFGVRDSEGVDWLIQDVTDWSSTPVHSESADRSWRDGAWLGRQWISAKHFEIRLSLIARSYDAAFFEPRVDAILKELPIRKTLPMLVSRWTSETATWVRVEESVKVIPVDRRRWDISIQCIAPEGLRYAASFDTGNLLWKTYRTHLPESSGGLTIPFRVPFTIRSLVESGEMVFHVAGTAAPLAQIIIKGPVRNPVIRDEKADWQTSFALSLRENQRLTLDLSRRTVTLGESASRRGSMRGVWPSLLPGEHQISWSSDVYSPDSELIIKFVEAYT